MGGSLAGILGLLAMSIPALTHHPLVRQLERLPLAGKPFGELLHGVELYQSSKGALAAALAISLLSHGGIIVGFYFCALALQPIVPTLLTHFYFMPIAETLSVFIPTPAGIGALEGAIQKFYGVLLNGKLGIKEAEAAGFIAAMAFRAVTLAVAAIGGVYYFSSRSEVAGALETAGGPASPGNPPTKRPDPRKRKGPPVVRGTYNLSETPLTPARSPSIDRFFRSGFKTLCRTDPREPLSRFSCQQPGFRTGS